MPSDRDPNHLYPAVRIKVQDVVKAMNAYALVHMPGYTWIIVEGFRTAAYQGELYAKGRTTPGDIVTSRDGIKKRSTHQSSLAVDLAAKRGAAVDWQIAEEHWDYLGHCARAEGLDWGGDWKKKDRPHIEWPETDKPTYSAARAWQKQNGLR